MTTVLLHCMDTPQSTWSFIDYYTIGARIDFHPAAACMFIHLLSSGKAVSALTGRAHLNHSCCDHHS